MLPVFRMGVQGPLYQDNTNKMWQLQGTIILETNFIRIYVLNYIFLSSNILSISLYITAWKMRNLNKNNALTSIEPINRTLKGWENNFKNMGTVCTQVRKSGNFLFRNPRVKKIRFVQCSEHTASSLHASQWTHTWCKPNAAFLHPESAYTSSAHWLSRVKPCLQTHYNVLNLAFVSFNI